MTYLSDKDQARLLDRIADVVAEARYGPSCVTCSHFAEDSETCALAGGRPPARVIARGCPKYLQEPPF